MTPEQFTYWLQGFAEITDSRPTDAQWKSIKEHLTTVFTKITPLTEIDFSKIKPTCLDNTKFC